MVLALASLAFVLAALSPRDLWPPDEPRYGQVAREMLATGDWLVPHLNAEPYAEKPPAWFWLVAALSGPAGGVSPILARLTAALLALGSVWLTHRIATRWFGDPAVGEAAALLFASSGLVLWYGPRAGLDLPLTFFVLAAVEQGSVWWTTGRLLPAAAAGVSWALAVLTKGPMGLVMPPLVLAGGAIAARRAPPLRNPDGGSLRS